MTFKRVLSKFHVPIAATPALGSISISYSIKDRQHFERKSYSYSPRWRATHIREDGEYFRRERFHMEPLTYSESRMVASGDEEGRAERGLDMKEDYEAVYITVKLPGLSKDDVKITLKNYDLVIIAEEEDECGMKIFRFYGGIDNITPHCFDLHSITAEMKDGVLFLVLPKLMMNQEEKEMNPDEIKHIMVE